MQTSTCMPDDSFWRGKNVFLTGHTGFKGGWLSLWLDKLGANVTGYSLNPITEPCFFNACSIDSISQSIIGNVQDFEKLAKSVADAKPDIIIHMAAQPLVLESYKNPLETYQTNLIGTLNILEITRKNPSVKALVNVTSDKCYQNNEVQTPYNEDDPMGGYDPYSSSKGCSELITSAYRSSFFSKVGGNSDLACIASARSGNVIGGGDWSADRLIPDIFRAVSEKKSIKIRNPEATRPWQHVLEPLRGYLLLAENLMKNGSAYGEAWNFGPDNHRSESVRKVLTELVSEWGEEVDIQYEKNPSQPHEANYLSLDISKASSRLNWEPALNIKETISMTCEWYRNFYAKTTDMSSFSLEQIKNYEDLLG